MSMNEDYGTRSLAKHAEWKGKIRVETAAPVSNRDELSLAYTPGVAAPCLAIQKDPELSYELTRRHNLCLVVTDGSAVLGLGNIGPEAGMPVMEGKCALFKAFGDVDAFPLCVKSQDVDEIVRTVKLLEGSFGGVNLEDISAPRCFEIEQKLREICEIPIFHDDQHGTAIVILAGLINALKIVGKKMEDIRVVFGGAGAAGVATAKLLLAAGVRDIILSDSKGLIYKGRPEKLNWATEELAEVTNLGQLRGQLKDALMGADVFVGVSVPGLVDRTMVASMAKDPIIFACANPVPEIMPEEAEAGGAKVVATGRSDYPNQINNVLAFPGLFRGLFDCRARTVNDEMVLAAAHALAGLVSDEDRAGGLVIPQPFDPRVAPAVAAAVAQAARETGVARK